MLLNKENSCLVLIDVQEKLTPLVLNHTKLIQQCHKLLCLAQHLQVPILISEQYPQGLGQTLSCLKANISSECIVTKTYFSCWRSALFQQQLLALKKPYIVLIGIETHVCILQSALDLKAQGFEVFVVTNAVSSRFDHDHQQGLHRLGQHHIQLVTVEMVFFEWLEDANTPLFKQLSRDFFKKE